MLRPKVKICGITNLEDALVATGYGADFLGFIFARRSPRFVDVARVARIVGDLPPGVSKVGVFVNMPVAQVVQTLDDCGLDIAQLHGDEVAEDAESVGIERVWKAFHLVEESDLGPASGFPASAVLADTMLGGRRGGTGVVGNWDLARKLAAERNLVLAGGIKPENIADAAETVRPYAIDVGSGVEAAPGRKDHDKLRRLFEALGKLDETG